MRSTEFQSSCRSVHSRPGVACCTEIERAFLPWLIDHTAFGLSRQVVVRRLLDDVIRYVISTRRTLMDELEAQYLEIAHDHDVRYHISSCNVPSLPSFD